MAPASLQRIESNLRVSDLDIFSLNENNLFIAYSFKLTTDRSRCGANRAFCYQPHGAATYVHRLNYQSISSARSSVVEGVGFPTDYYVEKGQAYSKITCKMFSETSSVVLQLPRCPGKPGQL